ncbi:MAG TPA: PAS domain S-box protein [Methanospirillum sp.]|nr:PAS domain S-box protein [Methanospirillum sp.]
MIRILFVDDEQILLDFGAEFFGRDPEFIIDTTTSPAKALTLLNTTLYDVIVSDYLMPEMDGVRFLKQVRERNRTIPFIFFTGRGNEGVILDALNNGANFFLTKDPEPVQKLIELSQAIKLVANQYRIEKKRSESEAKFRGIIENSNAGVVYTDLDGKFLFSNQSFLDLVGYSLDELKNLSIQDIMYPGEGVQEARYRQDILNRERNGYRIEKRYLSKENRPIWVDVSVSVIRDMEGTPVHFAGVIVDISKQKRMEKQIIESEQQLQALITFSPIGISMVRKGQIQYVNQAMLRMFGFSSGIELIQTPVINRVADNCRDEVLVFNWKRAIGESSYQSIETLGLRKDGTTFYMLITTASVEVEGSLTTIAFFQDISRRKEAEAALHKSENHYRLLAENMIDVIWILDPETGFFKYVSPSVKQLRGYTAEEVLARPASEALTEESLFFVQDNMRRRVEKFLSGNEVPPFYREEVEQPCKDGSRIWTEVITNYYLNEETGKVAIRGVTRDISTRKEAERKIRQSESALRTVLDSISDAVFIHDTTGQILDYNAQMLHMFQISDPALAKQMSFAHDYSAPDNPGGYLPKVWWEVMSGSNQFFEWRSRRPGDGSIFDTDIYMTRIDLPQGPAILTSVHDNTERKRAQHALEQVNQKLNLLSSITRHDILNSLTAMLGYLGFVKEIGTEGTLTSLIEKIDMLARTIKNQIDFTRDYQDMGASIAEWQEPARVFNKVIHLRKGGNIAFEIDLSGLSIYADPMLEKVIYNLIDNATRHGERVTTMRSSWYEENGTVIWVVEDNGVGVPEDMKERIFKRGVGKNTGLGLFLVREILSITKITIREVGTEGTGARFEIIVPREAFRHEGVPVQKESMQNVPRRETPPPIEIDLPGLVYQHLEQLMPEVMTRYTPGQKNQCLQDIRSHLDHLDGAVWAESTGLFVEYCTWVRTLFQGIGIPNNCLRVSLQAIKAAMIEADKPLQIPYLDKALRSLQNVVADQPSCIRTDNPHHERAEFFLRAILTKNIGEALSIVQDEVQAGSSLQSVYLHVFQPVLYEIGRLWHTNQISVGDEHYCTAAIQQIMAQFYLHVHTTPKTGKEMIALCVSGELHEVGMRIVADFFEMAGWNSIYLGANVPFASVLTILREEKHPLLAISCTMTYHLKRVAELIQLIRADEKTRETKIIVGGYPFLIDDQVWKRVGADACARDAEEAVAIGERLLK